MESIKNFSIDKSDWKKVKFGEVVFEPKESVKDPVAQGIKHVVGLEHIDSEDIHLRRSSSIEGSTTFTKKFRKGDVLFGRRRAYLKKAAKAEFEGICSGDITVMRANNELLLPQLLPFIVNNNKFFDYAVTYSAGGLSPRVKFKDLANFEFLLPPLEIQEELIKIFKKLDISCESNHELYKKCKDYEEVKSQELLGLRGLIDSSVQWTEKQLVDVAPLQRGFDLPNSKVVDGEVPVCYSNGIGKYHNVSQVQGPGVWTGRSGTIGNVFYTDVDYWPHNTTLWVTDFKGNYPKYIYYLYGKLHFEKRMTGTGVPTLNRNDIHKIKVKVADGESQIKIAKRIEQLEKHTESIKSHWDSAIKLRQTLAQEVF
jgi:type I restriction enzyme S subunit